MSTEKHTQGHKLESKKATLRPDLFGERLAGHIPIDIGNHGEAALVVWKMEDDERSPECEEMARRLVACWNACERLDTEFLERISRPGSQGIHPAPQYRIDELLTVLEDLHGQVRYFCETQGEADFETGRAVAVIAKVKGGAA